MGWTLRRSPLLIALGTTLALAAGGGTAAALPGAAAPLAAGGSEAADAEPTAAGPGQETAAAGESDPPVDPRLLDGLSYRSIGPTRGGRVTAVTGVRSKSHVFYMGSTGGGVWKTSDAGLTWNNVSDGFLDVASVGAVAVAPSDPNVIYVGTGSACIRGNASTGRGVYRSTDAGKTWELAGLEDSGAVGRIEVHPDDADRLWVAALGHPFGTNEERGVFRSDDGGETWDKVLYVSDTTGAVDLSMNPDNPREIYAAFWRVERKPWTLIDASEDGGIYKTTDGGDTWEKLAAGLPEGLTGRIGISVSPADPDRVWALVSAHDPEGGVYRSDDAGETWQRINRERRLRQRHWYYSHVIADPNDADTVYVLNTSMYRSVDGGESYDTVSVGHGDVHALWIHPDDSRRMIVGNDGGAQVSVDAGGAWTTLLNQPTAEFYRVTVDDRFPYRVYGAQQDNSTISVSSQGRGGPTDWYSVGGCESGHIAVDPTDPDVVYAGCYIGEITRYDHDSGARRHVSVYPVLVDGYAPRDLDYRFQWNAPILFSPHDPDVLYHTSNRVHRSRDGGLTWETISPDLTTDDAEKQEHPGGPLQHDHTSVEVYTTVFSFAESPHAPGELWAGSDDGLIHVSTDDGATWDDVTPEGMPPDGTVNTIELSPHRRGKAIVSVYRYRMDDWRPFVFRTLDGGETWELLTDGTNGIPVDTPVRVVREDPGREGLLYAGTEFGMYVSFDDGERWQPLQLDLPVTPITDLQVHAEDLVVATQGRSFWILDDVTPLHEIGPGTTDSTVHLFRPRDAVLSGGRGDRPAFLHYFLGGEPEVVTLEVVDPSGETVRSWSSEEETAPSVGRLEAGPGMHRLEWDLRWPAAEVTEDAIIYLGTEAGPEALPGTYTVRLTAGDRTEETSLRVRPDPRFPDVGETDLEERFQVLRSVRDLLQETHDMIRTIREAREQVQAAGERAVEVGEEDLEATAEQIAERLTAVERELIQTDAESRQDPINFPPRLDTQIGYLARYVNSGYGVPGQPARERLADLADQVAGHRGTLRDVLDGDVALFNETLRDRGVPAVVIR